MTSIRSAGLHTSGTFGRPSTGVHVSLRDPKECQVLQVKPVEAAEPQGAQAHRAPRVLRMPPVRVANGSTCVPASPCAMRLH
jgi:hypothetical protein